MTDITRAAGDQVSSTESVVHTMDAISQLTQVTENGVQGTVATISGLADLTRRLNDALGRFKLGEGQTGLTASGETPFPLLEGYEPGSENMAASDEEIKLEFIE
jgi:uncharacterized membrane protein